MKSRDNLAAALHMLVETFFWFHPLVWWIERRLVDERERACDEEVLRVVGEPEAYAQGILNVCKFYKQFPLACVSGVTGSNLKRRIEEIMTNRMIQRLGVGRTLLLAAACVAAIAAPIAFGMVRMPQNTPRAAVQATEPENRAATPTSEVSRTQDLLRAPRGGQQSQPQAGDRITPPNSAQKTGAFAFVDEIESAGFRNLELDDLMAFKIHGVSGDYIREIRAAGYEPTADELVSFKIHGVTTDYIREMRAAGLQLDSDSLVGFRIHGITPEYVNEIKQTGLRDISEDNLLALKIHGAEPDWIRQIQALYPNATLDDVLALRIHGVTPEFIREARSRFKDIRIDQLWQLKRLDSLNTR
jgi:hypothetical protein